MQQMLSQPQTLIRLEGEQNYSYHLITFVVETLFLFSLSLSLPSPLCSPQLLVSDNVVVIEVLAKVCKDHHADLACTLVRIFCHYKRVLPIVNSCLAKSIKKEGN